MRTRYLVLGLSAVLLASCSQTPSAGPAVASGPRLMTQEHFHADTRGFGGVSVETRLYSGGSSWTTYAAEDAAHAEVCASKRVTDLLGFGDLKRVEGSGLPGTVLELAGAGCWLIGVNGDRAEELFAPDRAGLTALVAPASASTWAAAPAKAHPRWLDCFDEAGPGVWVGGAGENYDVPSDFAWLQQRKLTMCTLYPSESRLVAPGLVDTSIHEWHSAMAKRYDLPYRVLSFPHDPQWMWNRQPLPYVIPEAGRSIVAPWLEHQANSSSSAMEGVPATDPYVRDYRRRIAENLSADPNYVGNHGCTEIPEAGVDLLAAVARTPGVKQLWHAYLANELGLDLARVGEMHHGDRAKYHAWDEVDVPVPGDFLGWDPTTCLDLRVGAWEMHEDPANAGLAGNWQDAASAPGDWVQGDPGDPAILAYTAHRNNGPDSNQPDFWMRRTLNVKAEQLVDLKYLHFASTVYHGNRPSPYGVWLNGRKLEGMISGSIDQCFKIEGLVAGDNRLVLETKGAPLAGHCFLGAVPMRPYPQMSAGENRLWFDTVNFDAWLRVRRIEGSLQATRAGDPNRPLKLMAMINLLDMTTPLCEKYGAYQHDTGGAGGYWCPMTGARLARSHGLPWSCEQGGAPSSAAELQSMLTFYLMYGNDATDMVFGVKFYRDKPDIQAWFDQNIELFRCTGKMVLPTPQVAVLRSTRNTRMGFEAPWNWDVARGGLQGVGRNFDYVELADFGNGIARQFPVVMDCGTVQVTRGEVQDILSYVRQGGTFVAQHHTAQHLPERADAWPLAEAVGLTVTPKAINAENVHKWPLAKIRFSASETLIPSLRGKTIEGSGNAIDYLKQVHTGAVAFASAPGTTVDAVASWEDGGIAVAEVRLGKGKLLLLGTPFTTRMRDEKGMWVNDADRSRLLDEMLTSLGAQRDSWADGVWAERWQSKNGVYDLYPVARMSRDGVPSYDTSPEIRRASVPASVVDIGALGHPAVTTTWHDGRLKLPQAGYSQMQSRIYAAPAEDIARGGLRWFRTQADLWRALPTMNETRRPAEIPVPEDLLPLADGWTLHVTGQPDRTVRLGAFGTLGLPENTIASFERSVAIPDAWKGRNVNLVFDAEDWFWGILPKGRLLINGKEARGPITPQPLPEFSVDATAAAAAGSLVIRLEIDGTAVKAGDKQSKPHGACGLFYLAASRPPVAVESLPGTWSVATAFNRLTPAKVGESVKGLYLETSFTLSAEQWKTKHVSVTATVPLGFLIINGQALRVPQSMPRLDVSGLLKHDGSPNCIRWVPAARDVANVKAPFSGTVPEMRLEWRD